MVSTVEIHARKKEGTGKERGLLMYTHAETREVDAVNVHAVGPDDVIE